MPRGRGGARQGTPGQAYGNRTDLNAQKVPMQTAPNQQYGAQTAQMDAMRAVPVAAAPGTAPAPTATAPAAPAVPPPSINDPSMRPDEHVMTGVSTGPGPGPEVLPTFGQPDPVLKGLAILNQAGRTLPPEVAALARYVQAAQSQQAGP